jgi:hypothetical protein
MTWIFVESTTWRRSRLGPASWARRGADVVTAAISAKAKGRWNRFGFIRPEVEGGSLADVTS